MWQGQLKNLEFFNFHSLTFDFNQTLMAAEISTNVEFFKYKIMNALLLKLCFELWCWRRLLRVPWTAKRSNQSILKEISPGCSLEGLMLKLKLQNFGHLMRRVDSLEKTLMLGGLGGWRTTEDKMAGWHHRLDGHEFG